MSSALLIDWDAELADLLNGTIDPRLAEPTDREEIDEDAEDDTSDDDGGTYPESHVGRTADGTCSGARDKDHDEDEQGDCND